MSEIVLNRYSPPVLMSCRPPALNEKLKSSRMLYVVGFQRNGVRPTSDNPGPIERPLLNWIFPTFSLPMYDVSSSDCRKTPAATMLTEWLVACVNCAPARIIVASSCVAADG